MDDVFDVFQVKAFSIEREGLNLRKFKLKDKQDLYMGTCKPHGRFDATFIDPDGTWFLLFEEEKDARKFCLHECERVFNNAEKGIKKQEERLKVLI